MREIKIFLLQKDLTKTQLCAQLGITRQYLHDILTNKRKAPHIRNRLVFEFGFPEHLVEYQPPKAA